MEVGRGPAGGSVADPVYRPFEKELPGDITRYGRSGDFVCPFGINLPVFARTLSQRPCRLSRSPVCFNLFERFSFGFRRQPLKKDPGGDTGYTVQPESPRVPQNLDQAQECNGYRQVRYPVNHCHGAHRRTPDL